MRDAGQGFSVVRPGGVPDRYGPVVYLEPRTPANRDKIGRDMFADPQRHAAMARARDDNAVHMTGPVRLDVDAGRQVSGVVMYAPVYRFEIGRESCRERVCQYVEISGVAASLKKQNEDKPPSK